MTESKRPLKVFLCHASADKPKVRELYRTLKRRGVQPWLDAEDLIPGQNWEVEIPKALLSSDAIIICLTPNSVDKEGYVQKEIKYALDKAMEMPEGRIFIIPARLEECDLPFALKKFHAVELYEKAGYTKLMQALKLRASQLERATVQLPRAGELTADVGKIVEEKKPPEPKEEKPEAQTLGPLPQKAMEKDVRGSQEKRMFYDLTAHYECDFENTSAETLANFLFESLTRIMRTVTHVENSNGKRTVEYQTSQIEYLDPKNGKTIQHALIVHGRKVQVLDKGDYQYQGVKPLVDASEMLVITVTQGVNSSRLRFDSNELPNDAFKNLVEWILADIGKSVTVPLRDDDIPEKVLPPKQKQSETKTPNPVIEKIGVGGDVKDSVIVSGSGNVINIGEQKKPEPEKPQPKKAKSPRKPNTAIIVALIGLLGTIIATLIPQIWPKVPVTETASPTRTLRVPTSTSILFTNPPEPRSTPTKSRIPTLTLPPTLASSSDITAKNLCGQNIYVFKTANVDDPVNDGYISPNATFTLTGTVLTGWYPRPGSWAFGYFLETTGPFNSTTHTGTAWVFLLSGGEYCVKFTQGTNTLVLNSSTHQLEVAATLTPTFTFTASATSTP